MTKSSESSTNFESASQSSSKAASSSTVAVPTSSSQQKTKHNLLSEAKVQTQQPIFLSLMPMFIKFANSSLDKARLFPTSPYLSFKTVRARTASSYCHFATTKIAVPSILHNFDCCLSYSVRSGRCAQCDIKCCELIPIFSRISRISVHCLANALTFSKMLVFWPLVESQKKTSTYQLVLRKYSNKQCLSFPLQNTFKSGRSDLGKMEPLHIMSGNFMDSYYFQLPVSQNGDDALYQ